MTPLTAAVVVLTMGDRPELLQRCVDSILAQDAPGIDVLVVANGASIPDTAGVRMVQVEENVGIPGGRNHGVAATKADVVFFIDDDARYPSPRLVSDVLRSFEADSRLGVVSLRIRDLDGGAAARRHVPRLRAGDAARSSEVTTFLGGASAIRRSVFDEIGPLPDRFFYAHEETDFAWRALDSGSRIVYRGDLEVDHAAASPARHATYFFCSARNRVWLARRRLPWPAAVVYVMTWTVLSLLRPGSRSGWSDTLAGMQAGFTEDPGERRPMKWSTVWHMTRLGRPPII